MAPIAPPAPALAPDAAPPDLSASAPADARVPARWLPLARLLWLALVLLGAGLVVAGLPGHIAALRAACADPACADVGWFLSPEGVRQWQEAGLSMELFAALVVAIELLVAGAYVAGSALIVWRRADEWMALFTACFLLTMGLTLAGTIAGPATAAHRGWALVVLAISTCGDVSLAVFLLFFPDGRFRPRWLWWAVLGWCLA
jgi:hypothetical protein